MEVKKPHPPSASNADTSSHPDPPRRRPGAPKRKASSSGAFSSTPSKRLAKDRHSPFTPVPPFHNGPVTRARQSPNKLVAPLDHSRSPTHVTVSAEASNNTGDASAPSPEDAEPEKEEPFVDLDFEAIRSRGSTVHVIPTHAGWFDWGKVHSLEERSMASFFDGKTEGRTPEIYVRIRDAIVGKFHANPEAQIETKDLEELLLDGDTDARKEVLEFVDHWGLVNFHPFPQCDSSNAPIGEGEAKEVKDPEVEGESEHSSLLEKLYMFDELQPRVRSKGGAIKKVGSSSVPVAQPRLLTESNSKVFEGAAKPEEPSVEYHCNACSADCSRKRYHCQKQADFDLCTECYNAEKFGQGMVASDFILMDSAVHGGSGGSWTDQETLLLLEALELFGSNWNEIAEHVATKTKAQCILHFIEMPIEDPFLEDSDNPDILCPGTACQISVNMNSDASNIPENVNAKSSENGELPTSPSKDVSPKTCDELSDANKVNSNLAMDALTKAFQAVDSFTELEGSLSFADAGNPVMALAAFIAGIVEPESAMISTKSSIKALYDDSPGIQLATRHCFTLDDPPNCTNGMENKMDDPPHFTNCQENNCKKLSTSGSQVVREGNQIQMNNGSEETKETMDTETKINRKRGPETMESDANKMRKTEKELPISSEDCSQTPTTNEPCNLSVPKNESCNAPCQENESCNASCQKNEPSDSVKDHGMSSHRHRESLLDVNADDTVKAPKDSPLPREDTVICPPGTSKEPEHAMDEEKSELEQDSRNADKDSNSAQEVNMSTDGNTICSITAVDKELNQAITSHSGDEDTKLTSYEVKTEAKNTFSDDVEKESKAVDAGDINDDAGESRKIDDADKNDDAGEGRKADNANKNGSAEEGEKTDGTGDKNVGEDRKVDDAVSKSDDVWEGRKTDDADKKNDGAGECRKIDDRTNDCVRESTRAEDAGKKNIDVGEDRKADDSGNMNYNVEGGKSDGTGNKNYIVEGGKSDDAGNKNDGLGEDRKSDDASIKNDDAGEGRKSDDSSNKNDGVGEGRKSDNASDKNDGVEDRKSDDAINKHDGVGEDRKSDDASNKNDGVEDRKTDDAINKHDGIGEDRKSDDASNKNDGVEDRKSDFAINKHDGVGEDRKSDDTSNKNDDVAEDRKAYDAGNKNDDGKGRKSDNPIDKNVGEGRKADDKDTKNDDAGEGRKADAAGNKIDDVGMGRKSNDPVDKDVGEGRKADDMDTKNDNVGGGGKADDVGNKIDDLGEGRKTDTRNKNGPGEGRKTDDVGNEKDDVGESSKAHGAGNENDFKRIKRASVTALAAAAVKAKILARQEVDQIRKLSSIVIGKQLHKLEIKLALLNDVDGLIMRIREQLDRTRKKLHHERTQIIAARFGAPAPSRPLRFAPPVPTQP